MTAPTRCDAPFREEGSPATKPFRPRQRGSIETNRRANEEGIDRRSRRGTRLRHGRCGRGGEVVEPGCRVEPCDVYERVARGERSADGACGLPRTGAAELGP